MDKQTEHKQWDFIKFNLEREVNIGSKKLQNIKFITLNTTGNELIEEDIEISDAMLKSIDEILVNSCDHFYRKYKSNNNVSFIKIITKKNYISIKNDGEGIPVIKEWEGCKNKNDYLPKVIASEEHTSSNYNENEQDRITGGLNGLGIKIVNIYSKSFKITTIDNKQNLKYSIEFYNNSYNKKNEIIEKTNEKSYTEITWLPDYEKLCKNDKNNWINNNSLTVKKILLSRLIQISVFINTIDFSHKYNEKIVYTNKAKCYFNNKLINYNLEQYVKMFNIKNYIKINLLNIRFPWYIIIGLKKELVNFKNKPGLFTVSLINGIHIKDGGSHVNFITKLIRQEIQNLYNIEITESQFNNIFCYFDCKHFPIGFTGFSSQSKTKITIATKEINLMKKEIVIEKSIITKIYNIAQNDLQELIINGIKNEMNNKLKKINKNEYKHEPAENYKKLNNNCGLFIPEGDSACAPVRNMIKNKKTPIIKQDYGTYIIQGVPPNAIKNIIKKYQDSKGETVLHLTDKLLFSNHFNGLMASIGLDYKHHYDLNKEGDAQFKKLNYTHIIMATDQDLDGIGHICSLVMIFINEFWPSLIKRNFFKRLATPIIRIYKNKISIQEFYSEKEYEEWLIKKYKKLENIPKNYKVNYYKGLASNDEKEMLKIGINISNNIFTLIPDKDCNDLIHKLYGKSTEDRKQILTKEVTEKYSKDIWTTHNISISKHLNIETVEFQLYNMRRKIKHYIDGMIPTQRKILCGSRKLFNNSNEKKKIFILSGYITTEMCYDHGDASLHEAEIKMAQKFDGSNNIPLLLPQSGGFGTRTKGRSDNGQARYIYANYNKLCDLLYPRCDDALLEYVYEDGKKCEPKFYVPIVPMSVLENEKTPGTGWKITVWARDYDTVINYVKLKINNEAISKNKLPALKGKLWNKHNKMKYTYEYGIEYCYAKFNYNKAQNKIIVEDLPIRVWSNSFKIKHMGINPKTGKNYKIDNEGNHIEIKKTNFIKKIQDDTANYQVDMHIYFEDGGYNKLLKYCKDNNTTIEEYLHLKKKLTSELNMINENRYITEFKNYEEIIDSWFIHRKNLYILRIQREIIILEIKINLNENILRFIKIDSDKNKKLNIDKDLEENERIKLLETNKFIKFNTTNLNNIKNIKTEEITNEIYKNNSSYNYIDNITIGDKSKKSIIKLEETIINLKNELQILKDTTWQKLWLKEINEFTRKLKVCIRNNWE